MNKFTNTDLRNILEKQSELNIKYTGEAWREVGRTKFFFAVVTEFAEFLESSPQEWKWWRKNKTINNWKYETLLSYYVETMEEAPTLIHLTETNIEGVMGNYTEKTNLEKYSILYSLDTLFQEDRQ
jgi:hypothetical protein